MSTKAMRRFLNLYGESREGVLQSPLGRDALAEVEAIEAAARDLTSGASLAAGDVTTIATLESIAKDAP